jgi:eukaryotic-like serine/threonine-protein kinase
MAMIARSFEDGGRPHDRKTAQGRRPPRQPNPEAAAETLSKAASRGSWDERIDSLLTEFTNRWEHGERPRAEEYLPQLDPTRIDDVLVLIYREHCLAEEAALSPTVDDYIERFPELEEKLRRLFGVHDQIGSSDLHIWDESDGPPMPRAGDQIGAYRLIRELGRGGFASVFLAVQSDLADRLIVLKISSRVTVEPNLLARASHPNIVDIHWHRIIEDGALHVIAMPFLGGATLSAILERRRKTGIRPATGRGLLTVLDEVAAPEYPPPRTGRPAREAIEELSYSRAVARIVAQLAEALGFAYSRGVLHGDVKPSNVLLTADGVPMLLDFNLAVGWQPVARHSANEEMPDIGAGTLPYMAPERLRAVAELGIAPPPCPTPADRHRADIYSLGVLLLELLTGQSPDLQADRRLSISQMASVYVSSRTQGGAVLIRDAHGPVPAGLRAMLAKCLAPDPQDRYRLATHLAEDLDQWRQNQPLIYAKEPRLSPGLFRWVRRRRAALSAIGIGLALAVLAMGVVWSFASAASAKSAREKSDHFFNGTNSGAFVGRFGVGRPPTEDPAVAARHRLEHFGAFESTDWRKRDDVRQLPLFERQELEVWLLEQSLRFAHALRDRNDPEDWRRALMHIEPVALTSPFQALREECLELRRRLKLPTSPSPALTSGVSNVPIWMDEYLSGVAAELRPDAIAAEGHYFAELRPNAVAAEGHYFNVCSERPNSFWRNYRNAVVIMSLGWKARYDDGLDAAIVHFERAVKSLKICVRQRPSNANLRLMLAGCLFHSEQYREADGEWEKASELDPDFQDVYLSRSFLRLKQGRVGDVFADISRFNTLIGWRSPEPTLKPTLGLLNGRDEAGRIGPGALGDLNRDMPEVRFDLAHELLSQPPEFLDQDARVLALSELARVLQIQPNDLTARFYRGRLLRGSDPQKADSDFRSILRSPLFESYLKQESTRYLISASEHTVQALIRDGSAREAVFTALNGVQLAHSVAYREFQANVVLAQAYVALAKDEPECWPRVLESFRAALRLDPKGCAEEYGHPEFGWVRARLGATLADALGSSGAP